MDSDDSDSELDIETSTTPDNVSVGDAGSESGRKEVGSSLTGLGIKAENAENSVIGGIGGTGVGTGAAAPITPTSFAPIGRSAVQNSSAAMAAAAAAGLAAASVNPDYATLAAKNWLKAQDPSVQNGVGGLHSFFMPFSAPLAAAAAAAHHAHLPFPHHFNSQGSLFHVKDSV